MDESAIYDVDTDRNAIVTFTQVNTFQVGSKSVDL